MREKPPTQPEIQPMAVATKQFRFEYYAHSGVAASCPDCFTLNKYPGVNDPRGWMFQCKVCPFSGTIDVVDCIVVDRINYVNKVIAEAISGKAVRNYWQKLADAKKRRTEP